MCKAQYILTCDGEVSRFKLQTFPFSRFPLQLARSFSHLPWPLEVVDDWGAEHQPNPSKWLPAMNPNLKEAGNPSCDTKYVKGFFRLMSMVLTVEAQNWFSCSQQFCWRHRSFVLCWGGRMRNDRYLNGRPNDGSIPICPRPGIVWVYDAYQWN